MFKKIFGIGIFLLGIGLTSCSEKPSGPINVKINHYENYQDMVEAESIFYEKYQDENKLVFDLKESPADLRSVKYFIGGICYCEIEEESAKRCDENTNCLNLKNRELFVDYLFNDGDSTTLIYKNLSADKSNGFKWIESKGGNCYRYEDYLNENISKDSYSYILTDANGNSLCGLKIGKENEARKQLFFDLIIKSLPEF